MREMKDSGIDWLPKVPKSWRVIPFKHLFKEMDRPVRDNDEIITCFRDGEVTLRRNRREDGFTMADKEVGYQHIAAGDLVVHGMDGFAGSIGISDSDGKATPVLIVLNPLHDECSRYFMYLLRVYAQLEVFLATSSGIRVRSCALNWKKLGSLPAVVPAVYEQRRIVDYLDDRCDAIDEVRHTLSDEIEALRRLRRATIHRAVTKGLDDGVPMRDSGVEWIGETPETWQVVNSKGVFEARKERARKDDIMLSASQRHGMIPQEQYDDVEGYKTVKVVKDADILRHVEPGDFVISMRSFQGGLEYSEYRGKMSSAYLALHVRQGWPIADGYYKYLFKSYRYIISLQRTSNLVRDGQALRYANFVQVKIPYPPVEEQNRIADYLDERCAAIDSVIDTRMKQLQRLDEYRKALIFAYVTGKKEVPSHE